MNLLDFGVRQGSQDHKGGQKSWKKTVFHIKLRIFPGICTKIWSSVEQ